MHLFSVAGVFVLVVCTAFLRYFSDGALITLVGVYAVVIFVIANRIMQHIEKNQSIGWKDHFRQSALLYLAIPVLFFMYPRCSQTDLDNYCGDRTYLVGALNSTLSIIGFALVVNIAYLIHKRWKIRKKTVEKPPLDI